LIKEAVANESVVDALRAALEKDNYIVSPKRPFGAQGVDVIAEKDGEKIVAEVIGYKFAGSSRRSDFAVAFWAAIGRVDIYPDAKIVIALPAEFEKGFGARIDPRRMAWKRIGEAFPELEIWFIDTILREYQRYLWAQIEKHY
jgi:hypothetical protein